MTTSLLSGCGLTLEDVDVIAVAAGPGSFTGLRIGVAAAKGLAWPGSKPCAACSTLESMAWNLAHTGLEICAEKRNYWLETARFYAILPSKGWGWTSAWRPPICNSRARGAWPGAVWSLPDRAC